MNPTPRFFPQALCCALLLSSLAARAQAGGSRTGANVTVADDGGLDPGTVRALVSLAKSELRKRGVPVSEEPSAGGRTFALRVGGHLGAKIPLTFEEVQGERVVATASLSASRIEDADVVMVRLVDAVLERRSPSDGATMTTVTEQEARPFQKKPGERFWIIGLPLPLFGSGSLGGFSLAYGYEADLWRVEVFGEFASRGNSNGTDATSTGLFGLGGDYIPLQSEFSPFVGGGIGYGGGSTTTGIALKLDAGIEAFRLHAVRALAGVDLIIPLGSSSSPNAKSVYPLLHLRFGF